MLNTNEQHAALSMFDKTRKLASKFREDEGLALLALCQTIIAQRPIVDEVAILQRVRMTLHVWHKRERQWQKKESEFVMSFSKKRHPDQWQ